MIQVFNLFKEYFSKRYSEISVLHLNEDSLRYDFFLALMNEKQLQPHELLIEHPLSELTFQNLIKEGSKRKLKPLIDLMVSTNDINVCFEFAFFRRNSNPNGPTSITENLYKMLNDFIRLGLQSHISSSDAYFVCVADETMMGRRLNNKLFDSFPAKRYEFDNRYLEQAIKGYKFNKIPNDNDMVRDGSTRLEIKGIVETKKYISSKKLDKKFTSKLDELKLKVISELVFEEKVESVKNEFETWMLIWKVKSISQHNS